MRTQLHTRQPLARSALAQVTSALPMLPVAPGLHRVRHGAWRPLRMPDVQRQGPPSPAPLSTTCRAASSAMEYPFNPPRRWWSLSSPHDEEIASVALPALCAMLMEPVVGAINSAFVGQIGTMELGAVSIGSLAISFTTFLFSFLLFLTIPEVAAAVASKDPHKVSKVASKGLWVAAGCGMLSCIGTIVFTDAIVNYLRPPEPAVAKYATEFIRVRAFGIIPALIAYVSTAVFRGHKDTRTPLFGAITSAVCSLSLNVLFLQVFQWGVYGSALASTLATTLSCTVMCSLMVGKGMVRLQDLVKPPPLEAVLPMLRAAVPLTVRNIVSFGMILYASALCVRAGSVYQASFEVIRQLWLLSIQFFECLNVATQVLCAAYLGSGAVGIARDVMLRIVVLGVVVAGTVGLTIYALQMPFTLSFTSDPAVVAQVLLTLPMMALFLPLDAVASIMDGSLMAAKQTDWLSITQIVAASFQFLILYYVAQNDMVHCLSIWACLKLLTVFRVAGGWFRNFASPNSAYLADQRRPFASSLASSSSSSSLVSVDAPAASTKPAPAPAVATPGTTGMFNPNQSSKSEDSAMQVTQYALLDMADDLHEELRLPLTSTSASGSHGSSQSEGGNVGGSRSSGSGSGSGRGSETTVSPAESHAAATAATATAAVAAVAVVGAAGHATSLQEHFTGLGKAAGVPETDEAHHHSAELSTAALETESRLVVSWAAASEHHASTHDSAHEPVTPSSWEGWSSGDASGGSDGGAGDTGGDASSD